MSLNEVEEVARRRICLALDVPRVRDALALAEELGDLVGMFKVGKELHCAACNEGVPPIIREIHNYSPGGSPNVFLDLKLHDTPATVYSASLQCAVPGVYMFNLHVSGGEKMCAKAVEAAEKSRSWNGGNRPKVIGVTELTSLNDEDLKVQGLEISYKDLVRRRTELAKKWGLDGIVCPANVAGQLEKEFGSDFLYVTPGVEYGGISGPGQKQLYTPENAVRDCKSSILVIGSAITKATDRRATALEIIQSMVPYVGLPDSVVDPSV